jgi:NAD(P)-dependent dehydrogenase (short-subunit alcohol dehydrogenase family)
VVPGFVLTPANADATAETRELVSRSYPMPRLCTAEDVANAVSFLASDEAGFINGTTLMVEGGASIYMPSAQSDASG